MVSDRGIEKRVRSLADTSERISDYIARKAMLYLEDSMDEEIRSISNSSGEIKQRIKSYPSVIRKAREIGVESHDEIPRLIEDYIGMRISTPNKNQAKQLFEYLRRQFTKEKDWFCDLVGEPKFTPMTVEDRNYYSISTGYQAYHITFVYDSGSRYTQDCEVCEWPFELQVMSQLWEFWADYSRKYFYRTSTSKQSLPYQVAISKILDSADELMKATAEDLLSEPNDSAATEQESLEVHYGKEREIVEKVGNWLQQKDRLNRLFGTPKLPAPVFLIKIQEICDALSITLDDIEGFISDPENRRKYNAILSVSPKVSFLPPYQSMLMYSLIGKKRPDEEVVNLVNEELWLIGKKLRKPPAEGSYRGFIKRYDVAKKFGIVETEGATYRFFLNSFKFFVPDEKLDTLTGAEVVFELHLEESPEHGTNFIARNMELCE
ncbi:MAG: hypothetical protein DRN81_02190 [Thermoproteota archaeon]|nr:MAG: hypothetical protein DRN81_02190 [Candidatus Korarchaeota archaeon]